jgi:hypothetical protein
MPAASAMRTAIDNAFVETEAEREILEIQRCRPHHGVGAPIMGQSDRRLFGTERQPSLCNGAAATSGPKL